MSATRGGSHEAQSAPLGCVDGSRRPHRRDWRDRRPGPEPGPHPAPATPTVGAPGTITLKDGSTFTLAQRIADKITNKEPLNVYMSYQILSQTGGPAMLSAGLAQAAKEMGDKYGVTINAQLVGPPNTDPPAQISQVQQLVDSGQADCVGIEPVSPDAFQKVIDSTVAAGVPVMTVNTDSPASKRLAYYGADDTDPTNPLFTGTTAGQFTVDWAKKNNIDIKDAALITGDTTAPWAQGRMKGWLDTVQAAFPNMKVEGTPTDAFTTGYQPSEITPKMQAYMTGHPDVDFYYSSDWEARDIGQLIDKAEPQGQGPRLGLQRRPDDAQRPGQGLDHRHHRPALRPPGQDVPGGLRRSAPRRHRAR